MVKSPSLQKTLTRYALTLEYDGAAFSGWQFQDNAPTVQAALEAAVQKRFKEKRRAGGASRTDAGVHARGQVAIIDLAHPIPAGKLAVALNTALPPTVRVLKARRVPATWDPRQQSTRKTYSYSIYNRKIYSPLQAGRAWQVQQPLNLAAMRQGAHHLLGRHDFSSFRATGCEAKHPIRTLSLLSLVKRGDLITLRVTADAFLYHMVRNLAGTLVEVGRGRFSPEQVKKILAARDRKGAGPTAPAEGLCLEAITFGRKTKGLLTETEQA
jgi:tRNA pseudouridine38-40 synthase